MLVWYVENSHWDDVGRMHHDSKKVESRIVKWFLKSVQVCVDNPVSFKFRENSTEFLIKYLIAQCGLKYDITANHNQVYSSEWVCISTKKIN
jgi:hypothetical protein